MMKYALAPRHRSRFRHFVRQDPLLIFDFDGALAPIVNQPEDALIPATTRDLLLDVSRRFACAVVSGRARDDLATKLSGIPFRSIVGNHGGEWLPPLEEEKPALLTVARWC
ncbi:MAG TPA: trehalose-phosphatase, partial [Candidatus Cybelea sp.]|nr:trehalose-phosphatase [Candidatus Cybelea sp.]